MRAVDGSSGTMVISGQSLTEAWFGSSAIGFGKSRQRNGC